MRAENSIYHKPQRKEPEHGTDEDRSGIEKELQKEQELFDSLPNDFHSAMILSRKWSGKRMADIAEEIGISDRQLRRVFNGESRNTGTLLAALFSMNLPKRVILDIMEKSPCPLNYSSREHQLYRRVIDNCEGRSLREIRSFLSKYDCVL